MTGGRAGWGRPKGRGQSATGAVTLGPVSCEDAGGLSMLARNAPYVAIWNPIEEEVSLRGADGEEMSRMPGGDA